MPVVADVLVPEPMLEGSGVVAIVRELEPTDLHRDGFGSVQGILAVASPPPPST
jgi:hypothetical protein